MQANYKCQNVWSSGKDGTGAINIFYVYASRGVHAPVGAYMNVGGCGNLSLMCDSSATVHSDF